MRLLRVRRVQFCESGSLRYCTVTGALEFYCEFVIVSGGHSYTVLRRNSRKRVVIEHSTSFPSLLGLLSSSGFRAEKKPHWSTGYDTH